jgi:ubiquitin carboxyl-terminal hydrolase 25/28
MFKGNNRLIKIKSSGFQQKLGYSVTVKKIFENLGFKENVQSGTQDQTLMSPGTDPADQQGPESRAKLLRAWVELGAWLQEYRKANRMSFLCLFHLPPEDFRLMCSLITS